MREIELKFAVHPSFDVPEIEGRAGVVEVQEQPTLTLHSTYYDTVDLRLARNGVTLRYRKEDNGSLWTLKLPIEDKPAEVRNEIDFVAPPQEIPSDAVDLVVGFTRAAPLDEVATLETKRARWKLIGKGDTELAIVYHDEVAVIDDDRALTRFREIELESLGVGIKKLVAIGEALREAGAVPSEPVPKAVRALGPRATAPPDVPSLPKLEPSGPAGDAVKAILVRSIDRLIANHAAARLGDDEVVHQMRVAVRRLRSCLRTFDPLIDPSWSSETIPELKWLADLLGDVRDLDVLKERFDRTGIDLKPEIEPLFEAIADGLTGSRAALHEGLRSKRYSDLLERLVRSAQNPPVTPEATRPAVEALTPHVMVTWKKLRKAVKAAGKKPSAEALHRIRIRAKRARYAVEATAPALGASGRKAAGFAKAAARLQDVLGEHQDAVVAESKIRGIAGRNLNGSYAVAAGRLIERQTTSAAEARRVWPKAWERLDRKKSRSWLME